MTTRSRVARAAALAAALTLTVTALPATAAPSLAATGSSTCRDFSDVRPGSTFHQPITWLSCQGITSGYADGTFGTAQSITRAETAAFTYRMTGVDRPATTAPFQDVTAAWSFAPIAWLKDRKVVSGYADGTFRPTQPISRGEAAKIIHGAVNPPAVKGSPSFPDVSSRSSFREAIAWLAAEGIVTGYADGTFRPGQEITRGEIAQIIHGIATGTDGAPAPSPVPDPVKVPASFTATGSGWGHGVGMSQYGARALAAGGSSATQILGHYYAPAQVMDSTHRAAENIRVHLHSAGSSTLSGSGQLRVRIAGAVKTTTGDVKLGVSGGKVVAALPGGTRLSAPSAVLEWPGTRFWAGTASTLTVPDADGGARPVTLRHGKVVVTVVDGKLNIVNELRMNDEYLYGLAEMPSSWPAAALQAQAIASRSYALRNMGAEKTACGCHVWDEVKSQKFTGWAKENERSGSTHWGARWTAAVNATLTRAAGGAPARAQSLWYGGAVADATYYSSSGGHTRNSQDVWSSAVPYLTARADPYSVAAAAGNPNAAWTATVTQAQLGKAFGVKDIVKVTVKQGADRTPATLTATTADGKKATITGAAFRSAVPLKAAWLRSITAR